MSVFIGYDPREIEAFAVARAGIEAHYPPQLVFGLHLPSLRASGLYSRPTSRHPNQGGPGGQLWDDISNAPMSTEFAISRFLTPFLAPDQWALFKDCDMLIRANINELFRAADDRYAVMCVKHNHQVSPYGETKMNGSQQVGYARKNWSSVMLFNCRHPANRRLTLDMVNTLPGRDLHRFCWLEDDEIGELDPAWNWIPGVSAPSDDPKIVHFSLGVPTMRGYENQPYADEWRAQLAQWVSGSVDLSRVSRTQSTAA